MKKMILGLCMVFALTLAFSSCGKNDNESTSDNLGFITGNTTKKNGHTYSILFRIYPASAYKIENNIIKIKRNAHINIMGAALKVDEEIVFEPSNTQFYAEGIDIYAFNSGDYNVAYESFVVLPDNLDTDDAEKENIFYNNLQGGRFDCWFINSGFCFNTAYNWLFYRDNSGQMIAIDLTSDFSFEIVD